jgi:hypothetical protein
MFRPYILWSHRFVNLLRFSSLSRFSEIPSLAQFI